MDEQDRKSSGVPKKAPVIEPGQTFASVTDQISAIVLTNKTPRVWIFGFAVAFTLVMLLMFAISYLLAVGVGIWGIKIPVAWGFAIVNFVWWIGIGHAGTLISAILLLMHQDWRKSINRFAEAMTLFAVACAGMFPLLHLGRPWFFYWLFPYPSTMGLWPQFRSPLVWDVFAVSTSRHGVVLVLVHGSYPRTWATLRDRGRHWLARKSFGAAGDGLARIGHSLAPVRKSPTSCWPASRHHWWCRCIASSASTSPSPSSPVGTAPSSRTSSSRAPSSRALPW